MQPLVNIYPALKRYKINVIDWKTINGKFYNPFFNPETEECRAFAWRDVNNGSYNISISDKWMNSPIVASLFFHELGHIVMGHQSPFWELIHVFHDKYQLHLCKEVEAQWFAHLLLTRFEPDNSIALNDSWKYIDQYKRELTEYKPRYAIIESKVAEVSRLIEVRA